MRVRAPGEPRRVAYLYLAPAFLFYLLFAFGPLVYTAWLSFFDWDGLTVGTWAGLDNYRKVLNDPAIRASFVHSLELIFFYAVLPVLPRAGARVGDRARPRARRRRSSAPCCSCRRRSRRVVVAIAWVWIYAPHGPLNEALRAVGLGSLARSWLGDFTWALPALGLVGTWVMFGLCLVLFLAGIQKIPLSLYEAARVDGAGPRARVLRRDAAGAARRARRRADAHDDHGAAHVRPHLRVDERRARHVDDGAVRARLPERVRQRAASGWPRRSPSC